MNKSLRLSSKFNSSDSGEPTSPRFSDFLAPEAQKRKTEKFQSQKKITTQEFLEIDYIDSFDVKNSFTFRLNSIENLPKKNKGSSFNEYPFGCSYRSFLLECCLYSSGQPITNKIPMHYKGYTQDFIDVSFEIKYSDLPLDTYLYITMYDCFKHDETVLIGGTSIAIFNSNKMAKTGKHQIKVWKDLIADIINTPGELSEEDLYSNVERIQINSTSQTSWLDSITQKKITSLKKERIYSKDEMYFNLQFLSFDYPIVHSQFLEDHFIKSRQRESFIFIENTILTSDQTSYENYDRNSTSKETEYYIEDLELDQLNPAEQKYLSTSLNSMMNATDLIPTSNQVKKLNQIIGYTCLHDLPPEDRTMIWKFRYYLKSKKKALVPFLRIIDWENQKQTIEAQKLLEEWSKPDVEDALILISRMFKDAEPVRKYSVNILVESDNDILIDILLQLVQCLRYEKKGAKSELANFLISRSMSNFEIANNLNWYLTVESSDRVYSNMYYEIKHQLWIHMYKSPDLKEHVDKITRQEKLVSLLLQVSKELKSSSAKRPAKIEKLKKILASKSDPYNWNGVLYSSGNKKIDPCALPLPLQPKISAISLFPNECSIFVSAKSPILVTFKDAASNEKFPIIWKTGDDLRQDQLVLQLINLMNKLLLKDGLDLKLTPYRALATSDQDGMLECVQPSAALSKIIAKGDIRSYIEEKNPNNVEEAMENFVKSSAGYCVITFILGIGDRHLDNILLKNDGKLFHIDFGFILGHDPKPFPPPVKLCKEMVIGMGGAESKGYLKFKELCCTAYNILRKNAHLILNLFLLMVDANIENIVSSNGDPLKNIMKVQEKFKLELSDEEAIVYMQSILNESEKALFPQITETFHRWAQYWRS